MVLVPHHTFRTYADAVAQTFDKHRESYVMQNEGRSFYYGRKDAADAVNEMLPVVDRIARPGDKLFVGTGDLRKTPYSEAFLYYLLPQTRPGTRYIEMDPGVANRSDSGLADDLASSDLVILSSIRDDWVEPNAARRLRLRRAQPGPATRLLQGRVVGTRLVRPRPLRALSSGVIGR